MTFKLASVPPPHTLHRTTFTSGRHGHAVTTPAGLNAVVYFCPLHRASAIFEPAHCYWTIRTPDTFSALLSRLSDLGVVIPDNEESRDWIEACGLSPRSDAGNVPH